LFIKLLQALSAEINIKNFIPGLGSLGMTPPLGVTSLGRRQRSRTAEVLVHQGKSPTGDECKTDQVNSGQKVVQGSESLLMILV